jgi:hypothetical protein
LTLEGALLKAVCDAVTLLLQKAAPAVEQGFAAASRRLLRESPEYLSMRGGRLQGELGLATLGSLEAVVEAVSAGIIAEVVPCVPAPSLNGISGGMVVRLLSSGMEGLLTLPAGSFRSKHHTVDWLRWLLTSGSEVVVAGYEFAGGSFPTSRTGLGIMRYGQGWRVPPEYAGTYRDNWLSRALSGLESEALGVFERAFLAVGA